MKQITNKKPDRNRSGFLFHGKLILLVFIYVGEPGIGPGPHGPKPRTLPLCYTPIKGF